MKNNSVVIRSSKGKNVHILTIAADETSREIFISKSTLDKMKISPAKSLVVAFCPIHGEDSNYILMSPPNSKILRYKCLLCHIEDGPLANKTEKSETKERRDTSAIGRFVRNVIERIKSNS